MKVVIFLACSLLFKYVLVSVLTYNSCNFESYGVIKTPLRVKADKRMEVKTLHRLEEVKYHMSKFISGMDGPYSVAATQNVKKYFGIIP